MKYTTYKDDKGDVKVYEFIGDEEKKFLDLLKELKKLGDISKIAERLFRNNSQLDSRLALDIYCRFCLWVEPYFRKTSGLEKYLSL